MWHEARKQEKKLRTMVVDYKRRAERRREFYEKFKADPTQFMQVHGRPTKIYLDPQISAAAENCMMPWQGNSDNMIDRFDVRAHLDVIPEYHAPSDVPAEPDQDTSVLNYERYRILIQNDLSKTSEDKFLHQIHIEEQFGTTTGPGKHQHPKFTETQKPLVPKAAIGYKYEDSNPSGTTWSSSSSAKDKGGGGGGGGGTGNAAEPEEEESDEEVDFDLLVNMDDLTYAQKAELNLNGNKFGLGAGDFMNYLNADLEEKENQRMAKLQEEEKQAMSGRRARRERRAYKDRLILRKGYISPPSYAATINLAEEEQDEDKKSSSDSRSRSSSPEKIEFITSFGGNESEKEEPLRALAIGPTLPSAGGLPRKSRKWARSRSRSPERRKMRSMSRSRSKSRDRSRRRRSRGKRDRRRSSSSSNSSRNSRSRKRYRRVSSRSSSRKSRSRDRGRRRRSYKSRSRSRSKSRSAHRNGKSRRRTRSRSRSRNRSRSRSSTRRRSRRSRQGRRSTSRSSSSSSSSRSRSRSRKRRTSKPRRESSTASPPRKSKSKDKERAIASTIAQSTVSLSSAITKSSSDVKNGTGTVPSTSAALSSLNSPPRMPKLPSPPVKRYYGRRKDTSDSESLSLSNSSDEEKRTDNRNRHSGAKGKSGVNSTTKAHSPRSESQTSGVKLTPQERLKRKMQLALNRQLKADKEAEKQKQEKLDQERLEREETLRELTIKIRRRERERRHKQRDRDSRSRSSSSGSSAGFRSSQSRSRSPPTPKRRKSRAVSRSP